MSPVAVEHAPAVNAVDSLKDSLAKVTVTAVPEPETVDLRTYANFDTTPYIGTEFRGVSTDGKPTLSVADVLASPAKLKALGKLVSERGVVFFRNGTITPQEQRTLVDELGKAGGKPESSTLHIHPCTVDEQNEGDEISRISSQYVFGEKFKRPPHTKFNARNGSKEWHSDITFENVPSDYASLTIRTLPASGGGDTLWASAYEAYDRLSPAYQKFLEGLTAVHKGVGFIQLANAIGGATFRENRGSPENVGQDLETTHPVIRTNPVTGWKGLFVNNGFTQRIVELTQQESDATLAYLYSVIASNHDLQVRFRWEENNLAVWDNRSTQHAITHDLDGAVREGTRSVSLGERPFFDPKSKSRREALAEAKA